MKMTNNNYSIKVKSLLSLFIALSFCTLSFAQRNTVWIRGTSINSNGWSEMKGEMTARGFQFNDLMDSSFDPTLGVVGAADQVETMIGNSNNVLGIAHDYGGIVLRDLQLQDPGISAMILDGVPNQGSSGILGAIQNDGPASLSRAQKLIEAVNLIRQGDDCNNCGFVAAFQSWVNEMEGAEDFLDDVQAGSPIINELNAPQNMPTVPYAVLWGSVEQLSLTKLLSSRAFPSDTDYFTRCFTETLNRERQEAKEAFIRATISNTQGFFGNVLKFIGVLVTENVPGATIIGGIGKFLVDTRNDILNEIAEVKKRDEELARILRCELSNQVLAAEWQLLLMANSALEEIEVEVSVNTEEYWDCIDECGLDMAWGDWDSNLTCEEACEDLLGTTTEMVTVFVADPNDGLLTKSEQQLEGAAGVFHLVETNHFQETSRSKPVVNDALVDLFEGGAGAAFIIPN